MRVRPSIHHDVCALVIYGAFSSIFDYDISHCQYFHYFHQVQKTARSYKIGRYLRVTRTKSISLVVFNGEQKLRQMPWTRDLLAMAEFLVNYNGWYAEL